MFSELSFEPFYVPPVTFSRKRRQARIIDEEVICYQNTLVFRVKEKAVFVFADALDFRKAIGDVVPFKLKIKGLHQL